MGLLCDVTPMDRRLKLPKIARQNSPAVGERRKCFYCQSHSVAHCPALKRKEQIKILNSPSTIPLIQTKHASIPTMEFDHVDEDFRPFITHGVKRVHDTIL